MYMVGIREAERMERYQQIITEDKAMRGKEPIKQSHNYCNHPTNFPFIVWEQTNQYKKKKLNFKDFQRLLTVSESLK